MEITEKIGTEIVAHMVESVSLTRAGVDIKHFVHYSANIGIARYHSTLRNLAFKSNTKRTRQWLDDMRECGVDLEINWTNDSAYSRKLHMMKNRAPSIITIQNNLLPPWQTFPNGRFTPQHWTYTS